MIVLKEWGETLYSRDIGAKLRDAIMEYISNNTSLELDFSNVNIITHSFADEAFGKLLFFIDLKTLKNKIKFTNASEDVQCIVKYAIKNRSESTDKSGIIH